jgi:hypothetical protein
VEVLFAVQTGIAAIAGYRKQRASREKNNFLSINPAKSQKSFDGKEMVAAR